MKELADYAFLQIFCEHTNRYLTRDDSTQVKTIITVLEQWKAFILAFNLLAQKWYVLMIRHYIWRCKSQNDQVTDKTSLAIFLCDSGSFLVNSDGSPDQDNPQDPSFPSSPDAVVDEWNRPPDQERLIKAYKQEPGKILILSSCLLLNCTLVDSRPCWGDHLSLCGVMSACWSLWPVHCLKRYRYQAPCLVLTDRTNCDWKKLYTWCTRLRSYHLSAFLSLPITSIRIQCHLSSIFSRNKSRNTKDKAIATDCLTAQSHEEKICLAEFKWSTNAAHS